MVHLIFKVYFFEELNYLKMGGGLTPIFLAFFFL